MGPWTVALAAAVDGINPCAFATILFFVSYLVISRRPRHELLLVGLAFTLGVFVTYLAVGLGAMGLLQLANRARILARVLYGAFAASCFVFAGQALSAEGISGVPENTGFWQVGTQRRWALIA